MAHTKSQGKTSQKSNRPGQRRGLKAHSGQKVYNGNILVRQVGSKYHSGLGCQTGRDYTIYAIRSGIVTFTTKYNHKIVNVL